MANYMLTTVDNPYNPFDDFLSWYMYDCEMGYYTSSYLARIANIKSDMSSVEERNEIERAIDEIIELDPLGIRIKIFPDTKVNPVSISDFSESIK